MLRNMSCKKWRHLFHKTLKYISDCRISYPGYDNREAGIQINILLSREVSSLDNVIIKIQTEITLNDRIDTLTNDAMQANADSNVMQMEKEKSEKNLNHRSLLKTVMMTS